MLPRQIGRYAVRSEIDKGGMATVYRAHDPVVNREVAVKLLEQTLTREPLYQARFRREAQILAVNEHPAILTIYDFGESDGRLFYVMPFMPGGSLARRVQGRGMPLTKGIELLQRIGPALDYAHEKGIVHRDLKPANVLFDSLGNAFLADFGLAHLTQAADSLTGDAVIGSPAYMSPELVKGLKTVDHRADIYALGVMLYEMLTGVTPFSASSSFELALMHINDPVPPASLRVPGLALAVDEVIYRAMAKEPADRYPSVKAMLQALEAAANSEAPAEFVAPAREPAETVPITATAGYPSSPEANELALRAATGEQAAAPLRSGIRPRWTTLAKARRAAGLLAVVAAAALLLVPLVAQRSQVDAPADAQGVTPSPTAGDGAGGRTAVEPVLTETTEEARTATPARGLQSPTRDAAATSRPSPTLANTSAPAGEIVPTVPTAAASPTPTSSDPAPSASPLPVPSMTVAPTSAPEPTAPPEQPTAVPTAVPTPLPTSLPPPSATPAPPTATPLLPPLPTLPL